MHRDPDVEMVQNSMHQQCDESDDSACFGVNVAFLRHFIAVNQISSHKTTAEVVEEIIKPQTLELQSSYIGSIISDKQYWTDLRPDKINSRDVESFE
jgi:hypothetical protein